MRSRKSQRGAAALEFALVFPVLLLLLVGIVDFGMLMSTQSVVANAAREGARTAALSNNSMAAQSAVNQAIADLPGATNIGTTVTVGCTTAAGAPCSLQRQHVGRRRHGHRHGQLPPHLAVARAARTRSHDHPSRHELHEDRVNMLKILLEHRRERGAVADHRCPDDRRGHGVRGPRRRHRQAGLRAPAAPERPGCRGHGRRHAPPGGSGRRRSSTPRSSPRTTWSARTSAASLRTSRCGA